MMVLTHATRKKKQLLTAVLRYARRTSMETDKSSAIVYDFTGAESFTDDYFGHV